ncbi:HET-domain-containing protein [Patellaria atrata CBS 101060]|uniref:HET-domain-containing protein n=1 Tax=Patellaria atrata CBS 101060 TaxID=1346257 RepID=A0A9P4S4W0_9PEZI|nr:HET-domain-containing protein [Patellaria atrata CBS 101060]
MRLLRVNDNKLTPVEFLGTPTHQYAILSHTWGDDNEEVNFRDLVKNTGKTKAGYKKIQFCGAQAANDGLEFCWVDTCCINKSSDAELSEAINSMFRWYQNAAKCYVYLSDVSTGSSDSNVLSQGEWKLAFQNSRWFRRGWTLQELIAPRSVEFFSVEGNRLGSKSSLIQEIHEITGVPVLALQGSRLSGFSVGERISWAARRQTKREEDAVYSLLGIFDVHMPLIYGEGRQKALNRLRREIKENISINLPVAKGASFDSHMEEHNPKCLRGTRTELLHHIMEWAKDRNSKPIFWLNGMAGTGKSTIARTLAQSFADQGQLGASFFFKKGEAERGNATRFFTTIATYLMGQVPGMKSGMKEAIDADPAIPEKALKDQFEKLILQPLLQAPIQTIELVVVIDALDECERVEDIRAILQLLSRTSDLTPVSLRVFVTSRPELHIHLGFKRMPDGTYKDLILHQVAKQTIEHDIRLFLEHELGEIQQERSLSPNWPSKAQMQALVDLAVPLFIFAATICRYIGDRRDNPRKRLEAILQYQSVTYISKLDKTYLPILTQLFEDEDEVDMQRRTSEFREVVGSIIVLESPLSISSLARLLSIPKEDIRCGLDSLRSVLNIPDCEYIPIRLLHLSFREFLVDPRKKGKSPFWIDEKETHERLVAKCLQLMSSSEGLRQNICNLQRLGTLQSEINKCIIAKSLPPELQYACRYWVHHLEQSKWHIHDGDVIHLFLQKYFLYWLEAMSLIGDAYKCIHMIHSLQTLEYSDRSLSSDFLRDAKRFILRFRPILEDAPLQIYSSALIFAPEISIIRKTFIEHIPGWITQLSKMKDDWDTCRNTLEGHTESVNAVALSPDGQAMVSASDDCTVMLWDSKTGAGLSTLEGHTRSVNAVAFSPDGQVVASASYDRTVRLWDSKTGTNQNVINVDEYIRYLNFSFGGYYLDTNKGRISIYPTSSSFLPQQVCSFGLFVQQDWVCNDKMEKLIWLPPDFRVSTAYFRDRLLILGHVSGFITFLRL